MMTEKAAICLRDEWQPFCIAGECSIESKYKAFVKGYELGTGFFLFALFYQHFSFCDGFNSVGGISIGTGTGSIFGG